VIQSRRFANASWKNIHTKPNGLTLGRLNAGIGNKQYLTLGGLS
jgi:hypothetical protein